MHPWQELRTTMLQLQCHLWIVTLLMQDHLGWSHQAQQVTQPRVVLINLLHLHGTQNPGTFFHGGTRISVYKQVPGHPMSGTHALSSLYNAFWGSIAWTHSTVTIKCLPSTIHFGIEGNSLNVVSMVDFGWWRSGPKVIWPECNYPTRKQKFQKHIPIETQRVCSSPTQKYQLTDMTKGNNNTNAGALCNKWN